MIKIISLVDDISSDATLKAEHGLCLYIKTKKHNILFDLGATNLFVENAKKLGINLQSIDTVIISHGHYDHGGGLKSFLAINNKAKVYINKNAFGDFYSFNNDIYNYIGIDKTLINNKRLVFTDSDFVIDKQLTLLSTKIKADNVNKQLMQKSDNDYKLDEFCHEQSLLISCNKKSVLISGCSHCGIVNILENAVSVISKHPDYAVGGFHLFSRKNNLSTDSQIKELAEKLNKFDTKFYTCHCTGIPPYQILKQTLQQKIEYLSVGQQIELI